MELTFTDKGSSVLVTVAGCARGATWGPAVDNGEWFVKAVGDAEAFRVADKAAGIQALRDLLAIENHPEK